MLSLKIKNTLMYRHNLVLLLIIPLIAAACSWALITFYIEGGAKIPVGVLDLDRSEYSKTVIGRFSKNGSIRVRELETGHPLSPNASMKAEAYKLIQTNRLEAVIVVHPGFSDNIVKGRPEGVFDVLCSPTGATRGLVAELFAAQVSRIYFNCDAANRVVRDDAAARRSSRLPPPTDGERVEIWREAFDFADAYWEPEPLMTIDYSIVTAKSKNGGRNTHTDAAVSEITGASLFKNSPVHGAGKAGWQDIGAMLNDLIAGVVYSLFFSYIAFCILNACAAVITEREDGVLTRLKSCGYRTGAWLAVSAAVPFVIYVLPFNIALGFLAEGIEKALSASASLLCVSALGVCAAYVLKQTGRYQIFTLTCTLACFCYNILRV